MPGWRVDTLGGLQADIVPDFRMLIHPAWPDRHTLSTIAVQWDNYVDDARRPIDAGLTRDGHCALLHPILEGAALAEVLDLANRLLPLNRAEVGEAYAEDREAALEWLDEQNRNA